MSSDFRQFSSGVQVAENKVTRLFDREHFSGGRHSSVKMWEKLYFRNKE